VAPAEELRAGIGHQGSAPDTPAGLGKLNHKDKNHMEKVSVQTTKVPREQSAEESCGAGEQE
jgi:hypothetical protein